MKKSWTQDGRGRAGTVATVWSSLVLPMTMILAHKDSYPLTTYNWAHNHTYMRGNLHEAI